MSNNLLISIEGIDGCGKSTLARSLNKELSEQKYDILLTKEPGGTKFGTALRTIIQARKAPITSKAEYLLFAADRAQHFQELIIPALNAGKIVISDRMADSSLVYQGYGRGLEKDLIKTINKWCMNSIKPNIVIYIKIDVQTAFERIYKRKETLTAIETEQKDFWERVMAGFEDLFRSQPHVITIDGTQAPEDMLNDTLKQILPKLSS